MRRERGRRRAVWLACAGIVLAGIACWFWLRSSSELVAAHIIAPVTAHVPAAEIEQALAGAVVVVGTGDIWLDTKDAFTDYIRGGTVVAEGRTDGDGSYALEVRGGTPPYRVIVWKEGYVPDTSSAIATIPATHSISLQRNSIEAGGKHSTLRTVSPTLPRQQGGTFTLAGGALSFDAPPGFGVHGEVEVNQVVLEGPDETMILGHAERGGVGDQLGFFADEFMKAIGPGMGADDLVSVAASEMQIAPGMPGIMRVANATVSGEQARFAFLFFTTQDYVYTWVYGARIADYQKHFNSFTSLLQTVRFK